MTTSRTRSLAVKRKRNSLLEVEVDDYTVERETHRGRIVSEDYDFSECDLRKAVDDQLPKPEGWEIDDIYTELN